MSEGLFTIVDGEGPGAAVDLKVLMRAGRATAPLAKPQS